MISVRPRRHSNLDRADLFHRLLRADVLFADVKHNVLNKLERVRQH